MNIQLAREYIIHELRTHLAPELHYHGLHHTLDVVDQAEQIALREGLEGDDVKLVITAALYHDSGFLRGYKGHEEMSCTIAREYLPHFQYSHAQIDIVCDMIMATQIPQSPKDLFGHIICDADLDYLGRDDFEPISNSLFEEIQVLVKPTSIEDWNRIQVSFIGSHQYFTNFSKTVREPIKQKHLANLKALVASYK